MIKKWNMNGYLYLYEVSINGGVSWENMFLSDQEIKEYQNEGCLLKPVLRK